MKLLLIHNNYGTYTGEEHVVDQQIELFKLMGYEVSCFRKTSEGVRGTSCGQVRAFLNGFYGLQAIRELRSILRDNPPDLVVVHNLYPFISPAVLKPIKQAGIPIVMTVHNYRLVCPTGLLMRNYRPCHLCIEGKEWNCLKHNCERSLFKSLAYAARNWFARKTKAYLDHVDRFACITRFQSQVLTQGGFEPAKMTIIPNFLNNIGTVEPDQQVTGNYVAIAGRLSEEKGIDLILELALKTPNIQYRIAGTKRDDYVLPSSIPSNCLLMGYLSGEALSQFYTHSRFVLIASRCYEGFPMTILEAARCSRATIAPAHAGFLETIESGKTGQLFEPNNLDSLEYELVSLWNDPEKAILMGRAAWARLLQHYTADAVKPQWNKLITELLSHD